MNNNRFFGCLSGCKRILHRLFDTAYTRPAKKIIITFAGIMVILLGLLLIILPGPAIVLIPIGLAILAIEYPLARRWLRKFQKILSKAAQKADEKLASFKNRR